MSADLLKVVEKIEFLAKAARDANDRQGAEVLDEASEILREALNKSAISPKNAYEMMRNETDSQRLARIRWELLDQRAQEAEEATRQALRELQDAKDEVRFLKTQLERIRAKADYPEGCVSDELKDILYDILEILEKKGRNVKEVRDVAHLAGS